MSEVVLDTQVVSQVLREIERVTLDSRQKLNEIIDRNKDVSSYEELVKSRDLTRLYGDCADDYSKMSYLQTGVSEAMMDLRGVRKTLNEESALPPAVAKRYRARIDYMLEDLQTFKEAIQSSRQGMEARVRFFNSCSYSQVERAMGVKC